VVNKKVDTKYLADIEDVDDRKRAFDQIILNAEETFLNFPHPKNPYDFIDKKRQKIEINCGMPYSSTSNDDIL
jgi:hypothetical protein